MQLAYMKMHGAGNQIVVIDQRVEKRPPPPPEMLRALAESPGFDQLMWVGPAVDPTMAASYRVFNADGSEVEQCGNGVRCVALMLAKNDPDESILRLESPAGLIEARIIGANRVAVNMGPPDFDPETVPFVADSTADRYELDVAGRSYDVAVLSMGNPHCVLDVDDVKTADLAHLGPLIEHHPRFPALANVGFMKIHDRQNIDLRVYERGAGETLACGTGACAAVVAGHRQNRLDDEVFVQLPGGQLVVSWRGGTDPVWLTGDAELISEGTIDL